MTDTLRAGRAAAAVRRRTAATRWPRRRPWIGLLFVAPMLVLFLLFRFLPAIGAVLLSLTDYRLSGKWDFHCR